MIKVNNNYVYFESNEDINKNLPNLKGLFEGTDCTFPCWFKREESWDAHFLDVWHPIEKDAPEVWDAVVEETCLCSQRLKQLVEVMQAMQE